MGIPFKYVGEMREKYKFVFLNTTHSWTLVYKEAIQIEERERKIRRNRLLGFRLRVDSREVSGGDVCMWSCGGGIFWKSFYNFFRIIIFNKQRYVCAWCCDVGECPWNYCGSIKKMFAVKVGGMETFGQCREKESFKEKDKLYFLKIEKVAPRNQILITR